MAKKFSITTTIYKQFSHYPQTYWFESPIASLTLSLVLSRINDDNTNKYSKYSPGGTPK